MAHLPDEEILQLIREGSADAYRQLFYRYYDELCVQATALTGDPQTAEDVVQEVFISFWEQKRYNAVQTSLIAYLRSMVRYTALDSIRRQNRKREILSLYTATLDEQYFKDPAEYSELCTEMNHAIEQLPPQCKLLFKAVYLEGKKYGEAADMAGLSINTVKEQLRRAFRKMRDTLKTLHSVS